MRREYLPQPFVGGMVTDRPAWRLDLDESAFAQDLIAPDGVAKQRRGWAYDGSAKFDTTTNGIGLIRVKHVLAETTQTLVSDDGEDITIHNGNSTGTQILTNYAKFPSNGGSYTAELLPRAVYRDEVLWCDQSGEAPLVRTSGATHTSTVTGPTTAAITAGTSQIRASSGAWSAAADRGAFLQWDLSGPWRYPRVLVGETDEVTLDNIRPTNMSSVSGDLDIYSVGYAFPCVEIDSEGSLSISSSTATGVGTEWFAKGHIVDSDAFLVFDGTVDSATQHFVVGIDAIGSDTSVTVTSVSPRVGSGAATNAAYSTLRRMPFKDVAAHKGSLWGTGVKQHPSRVYVGRPGWDIANPPGYGANPGDPDEDTFSTDAADFIMDFIDVPAERDSDEVIAILSTDSPLIALKRGAVYGVFGAYPNFDVSLIDSGVGCIDIRSAVELEHGAFWAGENGVYTFAGGQVVDLMRGKIGREWRALTRQFNFGSDYCTIGEAYGHLVVHITTNSGATQRTYICDYEPFNPYQSKWMSRATNMNARAMFSSKLPGEPEKLLACSDDDQGRVIDYAVSLNGTGDARDGDGTSPRLQGHTTSRLPQSGGVNIEARGADVHVHSIVEDAAADDSTQVDVTMDFLGGLRTGAETRQTETVGSITSDTDGELRMEGFNPISTSGRLHQIKVDASVTDADNDQIVIAEIVASFKDSRARS